MAVGSAVVSGAADVVVIGGGVIGAACAEALSRDHRRVVLIERLGLASGTSSACQSGVGHGIFAGDFDLRFDRAAIDTYRDLVADGLDANYSKGNGALLVCGAAEADTVRAQLAAVNAAGLPVHWLDQRSLREAEPALAQDYVGAAHLADMGQVSPMRLVNELAQRAQRRGAEVLTNTEVTGIEIANGRAVAVVTRSGRIAAGEIVIAAGAWSRSIGLMAGVALPVWPLKGHVLVTEPLRGFLRHYLTEAEYEVAAASFGRTEMMADGPVPGSPRTAAVLQPLVSGQILIGSSREFAGHDREVNRERLAQIAARAARMVPKLTDRRIIRSYAGLRPWTPDGHPLIGRTRRVTGLTIAAGHAGEGNGRSLITGRIVADIIAARQPPFDVAPLAPDRFDLSIPKAA
jgi:sarcosine oxidase subunit beta